jgi:hypothetical protein
MDESEGEDMEANSANPGETTKPAIRPRMDTANYQPKPDDVTWGDYAGPAKLSHRHRFIAHLAALGLKAREISAKTGYTEPRLSVILNNSLVKAEIEHVRKSLFATDPDQRLKLALPKALEVIDDCLNNPQAKLALRVDTAFRLMDRTHGKPKQQVEHTGTLLKDLFAELDRRSGHGPALDVESKVVDADLVRTEHEEPTSVGGVDEEFDDIDAWVEQNLGKKLK